MNFQSNSSDRLAFEIVVVRVLLHGSGETRDRDEVKQIKDFSQRDKEGFLFTKDKKIGIHYVNNNTGRN